LALQAAQGVSAYHPRAEDQRRSSELESSAERAGNGSGIWQLGKVNVIFSLVLNEQQVLPLTRAWPERCM
jgi:hypothetical protein